MRKQLLFSLAAACLALLPGTRAQAQTYSNAVKALSPVAYWPLNELATTPALYIATNSGTLGAAGNGYYETWYAPLGGPALVPTNVIQHATGVTKDGDTALQNSMAGQFVVIPRHTNGVSNPALSINPPFSVELWVYPTNSGGSVKSLVNQGFQDQLNGASLGNSIVPQGWSIGSWNGNIFFNTFNGAGTKTEISTSTGFGLNAWHHLVATFDGTNMAFYLDGYKRTANPPRDPLGRFYAPDLVSPLLIGAGGSQNSSAFGIIDEVAIYTNVLSAQTVTNHFWAKDTNAPTSFYATTVANSYPSIYLRLNEPAYTTAPNLDTCPVAANAGFLGTAADGRYQPGTIPGIAGPAYSGFGGSSRAVALNGFNAGVSVGLGSVPAQLNPTTNQPLSVVTWFQTHPADCVARFQHIVGHSDLGWRIALDQKAGARFNPGAGPELLFGSVAEEINAGMFVNDGNWHFAAGVSDGTNDYLYIDGMLAKSGAGVGSIVGTNLDVLLGGDPNVTGPAVGPIGSRYFNGNLAHVAFFTNALTAAQIQNLYGAAGVPPAIRAQPTAQVLNEGTTASIPLVVAGSAPMTYQWYRNGTRLATQTSASLNLSPVSMGDAGNYYLAVTNSYGWTTSAVFTVTVFQANTYAAAVRQFNPVGYWPLNETVQPGNGYYIATNSGTAGASGQGYYQTWYQPTSASGRPLFYPTNNILHAPGATGDGDLGLICGNTTGAGQYVIIPHNTNGVANDAATITAPFTIEAWVKTTNLAGGLKPFIIQGRNPIQGDASKNYTNNYRGFSMCQYANYFTFSLYDNNHVDHNGQPTLQMFPASNVWYHVALTFDNSTMTLYSNGVSIGSVATTYVPDNVSPLLIGTGTELGAANGGQEFSGAIDDVAIYRAALSPEQVAAHYNGGSGSSSAVSSDGPSIFLRLNEPAFNSYPSSGSYPVAVNYGSLGASGNGVYMPGTTPGVAGPSYPGFGSSKAVAFNGFYGAVDIGAGLAPAVFNPTGTQPLTVAAWFQGNPADAPARFQEIVSRGNSAWRLTMDTAVAGNRFNSGTNSSDLQFDNLSDMVTNKFVVNDGNWHMAVGVFDGANEYLYVDGALAKTRTGAKPLPATTQDIFIGGSPEQTVPSYNSANKIRYFNGQIAQVAFFTNALSASQIQQIYGAAGVPLTIASQPQSVQVDAGTNGPLMTFGVRGSVPSFQWYKTNGITGAVTLLAGQTNASLAFNPATTANTGSYFATASNAYNSVTSIVAQLTVVGPPVVLEQSPADIRVFVGTTPTLHASVQGPSLSYQWTRNNAPIAGATRADYTLTTTDTGTTGTSTYRCSITNSFGATAVTSGVAVLAAPTAPYPVSVLADKPVAYFRLNEPGSDPGNYATVNTGIPAYDYAGGNNANYVNTALGMPGYAPLSDSSTTAAEFGDAGGGNNYAGSVPSYLNFATTNGGNGQFSVEAWVNKYLYTGGNCIVALGYGGGGEQFVLDTGNLSAGNLRFFVRTTGGTSYHANSTYKIDDSLWHHVVGVCDQAAGKLYIYLDGKLVGSGTVPVGTGLLDSDVPLSIGARQSANDGSGNYDYQFLGKINDVAIYNYALSQAQVQNHYLSADTAPWITAIQPPTQSLNEGGTASITVTAIGGGTLSYHWYDPSMSPVGANSPTLTLNNLRQDQTGTYTVTVSGAYGSSSTNATVTVSGGVPVIQVNLQPLSQTVYAGTPVTYYVTVSGTPPFTYQWYRDGSLLTGVTAPTNAFNALQGSHTYQCKVLNSASGGIPTESAIATVVGMPITTLNPADYTDRMKITFAGYTRNETLSDFPVLVRLSTARAGFNYGHFASAAGGDLRFTDGSGTRVIPHEIDEWNPAGESTVWVQVPRLSGNNDCIWAYWGNPAATTAPSGTDVWKPQAWEGLPGFEVVYHLKEATFPYADSTSQHPAASGTAPAAASGLVGNGQTFSDHTYLDAGVVSLMDTFTLSAWVNIDPSASDIQTIWANQAGGYGSPGFAFGINSYQHADKCIRLASGNGLPRPPDYNGNEASTDNNLVSYGQWHLISAAINRTNSGATSYGTVDFYLDGNWLETDKVVTNFNGVADLNLGRYTNNNFYFKGTMDEARIQTGVNSSNWVWASYMTVAQNATWQSYSAVTSSVVDVPITLGTIHYQISGGNLILSGSGGPSAANHSYQVWSATNLVAPTIWVPVATNLFDASGNFSASRLLSPAKPQEFFRIVVP